MQCGKTVELLQLTFHHLHLALLPNDGDSLTARYGVEGQWGQEQYELCEAYLDYLGAIQLYNRFHAKFHRRLAPWLQVY